MKTGWLSMENIRQVKGLLPWLVLALCLSQPAVSVADKGSLLDIWDIDLSDTRTVKTFYRPVPGATEKKIVAQTVIDAPIGVVWQTVVDYDNMGKGSGTFEVLGIEEKEGEPTRAYLLLKMPWPLKDISCVIRMEEDEPIHQMMWFNDGGCVRLNRGRITLVDAGDKTVMEFCVALELGNLLPQWLVNAMVKKKLPDEIDLIREHVMARKARSLPVGPRGGSKG